MNRAHILTSPVTLLCLVLLSACGGGSSSQPPPPPPPPPTITSVAISPQNAVLRVTDTLNFTATVTGTGHFNSGVTWSVEGIVGGDVVHGTITAGSYSAPSTPPTPSVVTVKAASIGDVTKSASATVTIYSVGITPANGSVPYGHTQQFTAQVSGIANPVVAWASGYGSITSTGLYTAPTSILPLGTKDTISAGVQGGGTSVSTTVQLTIPAPQIASITPNGASAGETVTLDGQDMYGLQQIRFPGPNGKPLSASFQQASLSQITATVPFGATSGQVRADFVSNGVQQSASVQFTRFPNLRIHAPNKDLSSGETIQFDRRLLGASSPSTVVWTTSAGSINTSGLFQAPAVSQETYVRVKGCLQGTRACNTVLLRILPFRITPSVPVVSGGTGAQFNALQGGSLLSPHWSLPAGAGTITQAGFFTASASTSQGGPVPLLATNASSSQEATVAVTGAFPGMVSRVNDYVDYNQIANSTPEGTFVQTIAVAGNRAYCVDLGSPFQNLDFAAVDVYDLTDANHPVWIDAIEAASTLPIYTFAYGSHLFQVDSGYLTPVPSRIVVYDLQGAKPALTDVVTLPKLAFTTINNGIVYGLEGLPFPPTTIPIDLVDVTSGIVQQRHFGLPTPAQNQPLQMLNISGSGNIVYISWLNPVEVQPRITIAAYDVSQSPPALLGTVLSDTGFRLQVVNSLLFADGETFDISNTIPVRLNVPAFPIYAVAGIQGNRVLGAGSAANYVVIDISNPTSPYIWAQINDLPSWDLFIGANATWATSGKILTTNGSGGFTVYDVSPRGGPILKSSTKPFDYQGLIFDQFVQHQFLFAAGVNYFGNGGLSVIDLSSGTPIVSSTLLYPNTLGLSLRVSGNTAFLALTNSLKVVDVTNPSAPSEIGTLPLPSSSLELSGTALFVGTTDGRLVVVDVSSPNAPKSGVAIPLPDVAITMRLSGTLLFVADRNGGLLVFDVSQPTIPQLLSQFSTGKPVWDVMPNGSTLLLAADESGMLTVGVSNPARPQLLNQESLPAVNAFPAQNTIAGIVPALSVSAHHGLAYVGTAAGLIYGYDISVPASPRLVAMHAPEPNPIALVPVISSLGSDLLVAVDADLVQLDNSLPRNSIALLYPPALLLQPLPISQPSPNPTIDGARHPRIANSVSARRTLKRGGRKLDPTGRWIP